LKPGPVETYADQALAVAAASFAGRCWFTRGPGRAVGAALAAIPKAPLLAREVLPVPSAEGRPAGESS
jgi:hypothetical protein